MIVQHGLGLGKLPAQMYHLFQFDSPNEMADWVRDAGAPHRAKSNRFDAHYNLTDNWEAAYVKLREGWHEIRPKVDGQLEPLREQLGSMLGVHSERVLDMTGVEPDIERFLAGELECMIDDVMVEMPRDGKVFRLLVDCSMTFNNSAESIAKRGAALCALVEAFIMLGFQLEVWTEYTCHGDRRHVDGLATCLTRITQAGDPLDIDALMFCVGHPDFGRRMMWGWGEAYDLTRSQFGFNVYGYYGFQRQGCHYAGRVGASATVTLDGNRAMEADPLEWVLQQLEAQGIYERGE